MRPIPGIILHWPDYKQAHIEANLGQPLINEIRSFHMRPVSMGGRGWNEIAYHYLIHKGPDGKFHAYNGRPDSWLGAHTYGWNQYLGICVIYGTDAGTVSEDQLIAVSKLIAILSKTYGFPVNSSTIKGHRDMRGHESNECPGNPLHSDIPRLISMANNNPMPPSKRPQKSQESIDDEIGYIDVDLDGTPIKGLRVNSQAYIHVSQLKKLNLSVEYIPPQDGQNDRVVIKK